MKIALCIPAHGDTKAAFTGALAMMIQGTLKALPAAQFEVFVASRQYLTGFLGTLAALAVLTAAASSCGQAPAIPREAGQLTITELVGTPGRKYCGYEGTVLNSGANTLTIPIISVEFSSDGALAGVTQTPTDIHPLAPGQRSTFRFMFDCARWENLMRFSARDGSTEIEILDKASR